jgi:hypothetical protein
LVLAYVLSRTSGHYRSPVPLVREYILDYCDHKPDEMLAKEARKIPER